MNPTCTKNNIVLKIILSDSIQVHHNHTIDDLINNIMGIVARSICPFSISLVKILSERRTIHSDGNNGMILETVLQGCRAETIRDVILEVASTLRNSVLSGSPQMLVNNSHVDYRSMDEHHCEVNIRVGGHQGYDREAR